MDANIKSDSSSATPVVRFVSGNLGSDAQGAPPAAAGMRPRLFEPWQQSVRQNRPPRGSGGYWSRDQLCTILTTAHFATIQPIVSRRAFPRLVLGAPVIP